MYEVPEPEIKMYEVPEPEIKMYEVPEPEIKMYEVTESEQGAGPYLYLQYVLSVRTNNTVR
jgi:hypothetical protein